MERALIGTIVFFLLREFFADLGPLVFDSSWRRSKPSVLSPKYEVFCRRSVGCFSKTRAKRPYLCHTGRASNAEKQPTGPGPEGCDKNGPAAALLVGHVSIQICSLLAPCRRPILIATQYLVFRGQDTRSASGVSECGFLA